MPLSSSGVGRMYPFPCTCPTTDGSKARVPLNPAPSPHTTSSSSLPQASTPTIMHTRASPTLPRNFLPAPSSLAVPSRPLLTCSSFKHLCLYLPDLKLVCRYV